MGKRLSQQLKAFELLARAISDGPYDPDAILGRLTAVVRDGFGLARVGIVRPEELAAQHPLVRRAAESDAPLREGNRVAVALVDGGRHGVLIGDANGGELELDESELQLLAALARVAAVFVGKALEHGRLEASLEARTSFVSLASHELRTPIAVVHGIVSTLYHRGDNLPTAQVRELRAAAFEHTTRLALLTEQLLDLSRLEAGAVAPRPQRFRPEALVAELVARLVPDRRDDVVLDLDPALELEADPEAVERVLSNLLVNAFRYGRPPVRVRAEGGADSRIVVEDAGAGIDPELAPRLFERFTRGGRGEGAGLGLSIAASYADALGGSLRYEPAEPHGARFVLALPRSAVQARRV